MSRRGQVDSRNRAGLDEAVFDDLVIDLRGRDEAEFHVAPQPPPQPAPRIGVLIVAYNAASTLASVLDRIPPSFRPRISQVLVCDDHSKDSTYLVGLGYQQLVDDLPMTVIRHPRNLGYGGNQKAGYQMAIELGLDIIVLLHGDGQYAPECIGDIVGPLERGECDAVMGSRMMEKGAALRGGMPLYKFVGNRILTRIENAVLATDLSEFHSGYRAYRVDALAQIPFQSNSDGFNFDTQIIIQLLDANKRIKEVSIPTHYGDEICYVNGMKYARDVTMDVIKYRLRTMGFSHPESGHENDAYAFKPSADSSHGKILRWLQEIPPSRILDLGCSAGHLSGAARHLGHEVVGVDVAEHQGVRRRLESFVVADLDEGIPEEVGADYDVVIAADVIEHVRKPERLLAEIKRVLKPGGVVFASVPNFSHWYPRARTAAGLFDYDQRGILDSGHVRFFTRASFTRLIESSGFEIRRGTATGLPLDVLMDGASRAQRLLRVADRALVKARPTLFAYQFLFHVQLPPEEPASRRPSGLRALALAPTGAALK
jgi:2-polyprenyl-3-methyl-5-hydroxy-6-metoxy-1,4-benzoquinol methylase